MDKSFLVLFFKKEHASFLRYTICKKIVTNPAIDTAQALVRAIGTPAMYSTP